LRGFAPAGSSSVPATTGCTTHAPDTQGTNIGVVLTVWDVLAGRAGFPARAGAVGRTGLDGRPVPVEQDDPAARSGCSPGSPPNHSRRDAEPAPSDRQARPAVAVDVAPTAGPAATQQRG
jgi:hypothetical protein